MWKSTFADDLVGKFKLCRDIFDDTAREDPSVWDIFDDTAREEPSICGDLEREMPAQHKYKYPNSPA